MSTLNIIYIFFISFFEIIYSDTLLDSYSTTISLHEDLMHELIGNKAFDTVVPEVQIIPENCTHILEIFTQKVTKLIRCTINNARPIRICINCEQEINGTKEAYEKLRSSPLVCQQFYFESDQIGIIDLVYTQGEAIWKKNNCKNCYEHANETDKFFNVSRLLDTCILNSNQSSLVDKNTTCELCHDLFVQLNDVYNGFVKAIGTYEVGGICMDIVDIMNITRRFWNTQNCSNFQSNVGYPNIFTAVLVGAMPVLFYMLSKNVSIIEDVKLVRPKRKSYNTSMPSE